MIAHVGSFIDSLNVDFYADNPEGYNRKIEALFKREDKKFKTFNVDFLGYNFKCEFKMGRGYPIYLISGDGLEIKMTITHPTTQPSIQVKFPKKWLWTNKLKDTFVLRQRLVEEFGSGVFIPKRIDLNKHIQGYLLSEEDRFGFVGNFRKGNTYYATDWTRKDDVTGYRFGSPKNKTISFKIYNKTLEVEERGSLDPTPFYFRELSSLGDILTFEVTFDSQFLSKMGVSSLEILQDRVSTLWTYATFEYIQQKELISSDSNIHRRRVSSLWSLIQEPWDNLNYFPLESEKAVQKNHLIALERKRERTDRGFVSYVKDIGLMGIDEYLANLKEQAIRELGGKQ